MKQMIFSKIIQQEEGKGQGQKEIDLESFPTIRAEHHGNIEFIDKIAVK